MKVQWLRDIRKLAPALIAQASQRKILDSNPGLSILSPGHSDSKVTSSSPGRTHSNATAWTSPRVDGGIEL